MTNRHHEEPQRAVRGARPSTPQSDPTVELAIPDTRPGPDAEIEAAVNEAAAHESAVNEAERRYGHDESPS